MNFVAIDVETANADLSSICQIGIVRFENNEIAEEYVSYIDPEDDFDPINVSIHGIDRTTINGAPTFNDVVDGLYQHLDHQLVVSHTHFDRVAIQRVCDRHGKRLPDCEWLDTAKVARRTWEKFARKGYGLASVCKEIDYEFNHHDALEDAKAAAQILMAAVKKTGISICDWPSEAMQPITPTKPTRIDGNSEGQLYGETVVFTGTLKISRREATALAAQAGCDVRNSVTRNTTLLIVGDQDIRKLAGHKKSSKHRKADQLIEAGADIRVLRESDFKLVVGL